VSIVDVDYDPFSGEVRKDPYPTYRWLREHAPIYYSVKRDLWVISRYDDVIAVTSDWPTFSNASGADTDNFGSYLTAPGNFFDADPKLHDVLRAVLHRSFMPRALHKRLEPVARDTVKQLLEGLIAVEEADFAKELAWPLPVRVVSELMGIPEEDRPRIRHWGEEIARRTAGSPELPQSTVSALNELTVYLREQVQRRRGDPRDDLLSVIANATIEGAPIGEQAVGMATLIAVGAFETTASLIGNALLLLAQHPDQRAWLAENPAAIPDAIEEALRFESPAQHTRRVSTTEVEMHGTLIPEGARVVLLYGSANRDERRFTDSERFHIRRERKRNLAFGNGIHHCIGAPLARLQATVALQAVLRELPSYELAGDAKRFESHMGRTLQALPLRQNRR
jgi:cytochrome P450